MAKNISKRKAGDEDGIDSSLDIPDFDFESFGDNPKRNNDGPVMDVARNFGIGVKNSFFNAKIVESTIRRALPPEYGTLLDVTNRVSSEARALYNQASREIKPTVNQVKQLTQQFLPKTEGVLSKDIREKIDNWSKSGQDSTRIDLSEGKMREQALAIELGQIFQAQAKDTDRRQERNEQRELLQEGIAQIRHRDTTSILSDIAQAVNRQADYQDAIGVNYQRKSLEIQLRHYYLSADLLRATKESNAIQKSQLEDIVRNTALPDFSKMSVSKAFKERFRNRFIDSGQTALFGQTGDFVEKYIGNISKDLQDKTSSATGQAGMLSSLLGMMGDQFSSDNPFDNRTGKGKAADFIGGLVGDSIVGKIQDKIGEKLKANEQINRVAQGIGYGLENAPELLRQRLTDPNQKLGPLEPFRNYLLSNMPSIGAQTDFDSDSIKTINQPGVFTNATNKAVVEVIPGLLARIQRELVITRTGKSAPLLTYDYSKNAFSNEQAIGQDVRNSLVSKQNQQDVSARFDELFTRIDKDGQLGDEDREAIKRSFLSRSLKGGSTDASVLALKRTWSDANAKDPKAIAKFFQNYLKTNSIGQRDNSLEAWKNQRELSAEIKRITRMLDDPRAKLQEMVRLGQYDALQSSGLYNRDNNSLDLDEIISGLLGGESKASRSLGDRDFTEISGSDILRPGEIRNPTFMPGSSRDAINNRTQRDSRLMRQQRTRLLKKSLGDIRRAKANQTTGSNIPTIPSESEAVQSAAEMLAQTVPQTPGFDHSVIVELLKEQIAATKANDQTEQLKLIVLGLEKIEQRLSDGINTYSLTEDLFGPEARRGIRDRFGRAKDRFSELRDKFEAKLQETKEKLKVPERLKNLRDITLGDVGDKFTEAGKGLFNFGARITKSIPGVANTAINFGKKIGGIGGNILQKGADVFGDVYVQGESEPRLTYVQMKAGKYFDKATGKVLTSLRDIKGPVVDENGVQLLGADELENSYVKGKKVQALKQIASSATDWAKFAGSMAVRNLGVFYGTAVNLGIKAFQAGLKLLPPYDVYIKGQDKPVLTIMGFKNGQYFSKQTGKSLSHPREIDGPVLDSKQNYLITEDDIRTGLVDKNGLTVTNKAARLLGKVGQVAGIGFNALKGLAGQAKEMLVSMGQAFKDMFGGIFGLRGEYLETSKSQLDVQKQILQLLLERLPQRKGIKGDWDGDGDREGSAQDIRQKMALADAEKKDRQTQEQKSTDAKSSGGKGILSALAGLFGGKKAAEEEDSTLIDGLGSAAGSAAGGAAGGAAAGAAGGAAAAKSTKWLGKGGRLVRGAGALGRGMMSIGRLGLGVLGLGTTGLAAAVPAAASAASATAGAVGTGVAAAGTALGALFTAPVILTALGIAAVGAAAYYGYKWLTKPSLTPLNRVRFAQYGFSEIDKDRLEVVFGLEQQLQSRIKFDGEKAMIDMKNLDVGQLMNSFGMKPSSANSPRWINWFENRFKPVFLGNAAALKNINSDVKLIEADKKLTATEKLKFLDSAAMPDGPYDVKDSPFADMKNLSVNSSAVKAIVDIARSDIEKEAKSEKATKAAEATKAAAGVATGAAALKASTDSKDGTGVATGASSTQVSTASNALKAAAGVGAAGALTKDSTGVNVSASSNVPADFIFTGQKGQIDSFSAIRFKSYGLVDMDIAKIRDLMFLEKVISKSVTFAKDKAVYNDDIRDLLADVKSRFGIVGPESDDGLQWIKWFRARFLPVFTNYASALKKQTGKEDYVAASMQLTPQQQFDIANILITTTTVYNGSKVEVWQVKESPWRGYAVNNDSDSVKGNIEYLKETIKAVKAGEQKSEAKKLEQRANEKAAIAQGQAANPLMKAELPGGAANVYRKDPSTVNRERQALAQRDGYIQSAELRADGKGVRAVGDFMGGAPVKHPGNGSGGDVNSLPVPTGNNWEGMKAMYAAVSKMTGVDISTLAAITAIESGFDPSAKAKTSSATGLFQFTAGTWNDMMGKYAAKYGIAPGTPPTDPRANALLGAEFTKQNMNGLKSKLKKDITNTDVYMAHFLGLGGATKFLSNDPNTIGADAMPKEAAANFPVFYDKNTKQPRTFGEMYKLFNMKMDRETRKFGVAGVSANDAKFDGKQAVDKPASTETQTPVAAVVMSATPVAKPTPTAALTTTASAAPVNSAATTVTPSVTLPGGYMGSAGVTTPVAPPVSQVATPDTPKPTPIRQTPNFTGFSPSPVQSGSEINAQAQATRQAMASGIDGISKTLLESLTVHRQTHDLVKTLSQAVLSHLGAKNKTNETAAPAPAAKPAANMTNSIPTQAPAAPVRMQRNY